MRDDPKMEKDLRIMHASALFSEIYGKYYINLQTCTPYRESGNVDIIKHIKKSGVAHEFLLSYRRQFLLKVIHSK